MRIPDGLIERIEAHRMSTFAQQLIQRHDAYFSQVSHGDFYIWREAINRLPAISPSETELDTPAIRIGRSNDCSDEDKKELEKQLRVLMPWRKGPFDWFGMRLDAEWRSDLKWERCAKNISPLEGRVILDVGCGNGYYGWRMLGQDANAIVGIDPSLLFVMQYHAVNRYIDDARLHIFPFRLETLACEGLNFDSVFSMGVIYHRRDPLAHLNNLYHCLRPGGELVLETLIVDRDNVDILQPRGRYAKMNNIWNIPSCRLLLEWIVKSGFIAAELVDISATATEEQRTTDWMVFESLVDFLNADDHSLTTEGYPAPKRAVAVARRP